MTEERLKELRQIVQAGERGSITILPRLRAAASELLTALDDEIAGRATLRGNDVRLELLATTPAEAHDAINALFARIEIPVGPMYERDRLRAEVERLQRFEREYADIVATLKRVGASFHDDPCADIRLLASDSAFQRAHIKRLEGR